MKRLTSAEEEIMQILWKLENAMVKEVIDLMPEPKPAYNTVSTVIRILETKGFIDHKAYGKTHVYFPIVAKNEYAKAHFSNFLQGYFGNSFPKLASFFAKENDLSIKELEEILKLTQQEMKKDEQ